MSGWVGDSFTQDEGDVFLKGRWVVHSSSLSRPGLGALHLIEPLLRPLLGEVGGWVVHSSFVTGFGGPPFDWTVVEADGGGGWVGGVEEEQVV